MALHLATGAIERGDCVAALIGAAQVNRESVVLVLVGMYLMDFQRLGVEQLHPSWSPVARWAKQTI
jgi:hypothetical protein